MIKKRIRIINLSISASFLVLVTALFYFQVLQFEHYRALSLRNSIRIIPVQAPRGGIYDRKANPLAKDELSFDLVLIPQEIDDIDAALNGLHSITGIKKEELKRSYNKNYRLPFVPVKVAEDLRPEDAFRLEEKLSGIAGALIYTSPKRTYPNGSTASHVIGYIGKIAAPEFKKLKAYGYSMRDLVGKSGVEKYYDVYLRGEDGGIQVEVDSRSREVSRLGLKEPRTGRDLYLTIDIGLQRFMDMLFEGKKGASIVMESDTGRVLSLVSSPEFDPNLFLLGNSRDRARLLQDRDHPLIDRAVSCAYPPGSTFKVVVASAGIASGALKRSTKFLCKGVFYLGNRAFRCWKRSGHGYQNVVEALTHSCNVFFYNLGRALGAEELHRYSLAFGLGALTGIDLPQEVKGAAPGPFWKRFILKEPWYEGDTINYSIGQGYLLVTPVQMLRVITIVANEGYCPQPYLVEKIGDRKASHRRNFITRIRPEAFKLIRQGLFNVVNDSTGTGQRAKLKGVRISGKTGTAQAGTRGDTHAWFVGYLPAEAPKISFVVFVEHGGHGGVEAAKIARLMGTYLKENGFI